MELSPGYKFTEVGVIPDDWDVKTIAEVFRLVNGYPFKPEEWRRDGAPIIRIQNLNDPAAPFNYTDASVRERHRIEPGDLLFAWSGTLGSSFGARMWAGPPGVLNQHIFKVFVDERQLSPDFSLAIFARIEETIAKQAHGFKASFVHVKKADLAKLRLPVPRLPEQRAIAAVLSDVEALLTRLTRLISKKRDLKQAAMHQLLTGRVRLPGFQEAWETMRIGDIAMPTGPTNVVGERMPVLTCSKHRGFVDSLRYFKNQVFSDDLSAYRVIRRGEIGYPANHIEEGSIGLQDRYDVGLVSPIYVVFKVHEIVNSYFLHRLLKLDSYRHHFKAATTSSVDRRGSLRWPAFSEIMVSLPSLPEQCAIATVLSDMDAELGALEARLEKTKALKQAMMQELLTGRTRLAVPEAARA